VLEGQVGHYVFISTGQVYLVLDPRPAMARETDYEGRVMPPPPAGHPDREDWEYGVGKRAAEDVLTGAFARTGFPSTRLRIPMVSGERDHKRRWEGYLWRMLDGGPVLVPDGGGHRLRHVYSRDVAAAIAAFLGEPRTFGQAYNLCQEETPTLVEVLGEAARLLGAPLRLQEVPRAAVEAAGLDPVRVSPFSGRWMSFLDPARAREELAFKATPLGTALASIVASFLAHPPADRPDGYADRAREIELARRPA
jgi:nucleoside-diphosphate-sugar epimerase